MNPTKKSYLVLFLAVSVLALSSCHRGTGCPNWTKTKHEQTAKKSV